VAVKTLVQSKKAQFINELVTLKQSEFAQKWLRDDMAANATLKS